MADMQAYRNSALAGLGDRVHPQIRRMLESDQGFIRGNSTLLQDPATPAPQRGLAGPDTPTAGAVRPPMSLADDFRARTGGSGAAPAVEVLRDAAPTMPVDPAAPAGAYLGGGAFSPPVNAAPPRTAPGLQIGDGALLPPARGLQVGQDDLIPPPAAARAGVARGSPRAIAAAAGELDPRGAEAYDPETGMRDNETRKVGLLDRLFGEPGSDKRSQMSRALMAAGAAIMSTEGSIGEAIGAGIQAGLMTYDEGMQALKEEEREARKMGMAEEAHEMRMQLQRLQMQRAQAGGGGGKAALTNEEKAQNAIDMWAQSFAVARTIQDMDPEMAAALGPGNLARSVFVTTGGRLPGNLPQGNIFSDLGD